MDTLHFAAATGPDTLCGKRDHSQGDEEIHSPGRGSDRLHTASPQQHQELKYPLRRMETQEMSAVETDEANKISRFFPADKAYHQKSRNTGKQLSDTQKCSLEK